MLSIRLDSPVPIGEQILAGIRALIALGTLSPGDELPPVRQLAGDLGVNLNTVARAYRALESDGLVRTARGRGTHVTAGTERPTGTSAEINARLSATLTSAIADMKLAGLSRDEAHRLTSQMLAKYWPAHEVPKKGDPS